MRMPHPLVALLLLQACASTTPYPLIERRPVPPPWKPPAPVVRAYAELAPTEMRAHFIDVGQGDATLLEFPCAAMLIDAGGEHNDLFNAKHVLTDYLDAFFARRKDLKSTIELLVVTHPHIDHTYGVPTVLDRYNVNNVIDNGMDRTTKGGPEQTYIHTRAASPEAPFQYRALTLDQIPPGGLTGPIIDPIACAEVDPTIVALWGQVKTNPGWSQSEFDNANNHSVAIRVGFGQASWLFTGDLEEDALHDLVKRDVGKGLLDVDVYKAGHHGSYNGTTKALVAAMTPKVAVFSMGPSWRKSNWSAWRYGHPRARAVRMLQAGVSGRREPRDVKVGTGMRRFETWTMTRAIYGTGWEGNVVLKASTDGLAVLDAPVTQ